MARRLSRFFGPLRTGAQLGHNWGELGQTEAKRHLPQLPRSVPLKGGTEARLTGVIGVFGELGQMQ